MLKVTIIVLIAALLLTGCTTFAAQRTDSNTISADEAKTVALEHAGLTAEQVTGLRAEFDRDDGVPEWEVDFRSGEYEYDYTIHAETSAIRKADKDYERAPASATTAPAVTEPTTQDTTLTAEEAKAIALEDAGLTAEQVTGLRAEPDRDDGRLEWDVSFRHDGYEYDYTIHAETGKILDVDRDRDD